jgi:hypothetical protein
MKYSPVLNIPGGVLNVDIGTQVIDAYEILNCLNIPGGDLNAEIGTQVRDALGILNCFEHPW